MSNHDWPAVSVVIITRDRHASAAAAARSALAADYPPALREVLVMEETDAPQPLADAEALYHAIPMRNLGFGYARNRAVELAHHDILAFTDDDCLVDAGWLKEIVRPLRDDPSALAAAGAVRVPPCGMIGQCESILGFPGGGLQYIHRAQGRVIPCATFSTCNCAVRRAALAAAGGFDESLKHGGEDEALSRALAARGRLIFTPAAIVHHAPRDSMRGVFNWFIRRGRARRAAARRANYSPWQYARLIASFQTARIAGLTALCLALGAGWLALLCLAGVGTIYWAVTVWRRRWALKYDIAPRALWLLPWIKLVMDFGMEAGFAEIRRN